MSLYFAAALIGFAVTISVLFVILFKNYVVKFHSHELSSRAANIASVLSEFIDTNGTEANGMRHQRGFGAYMRFLGDIAGTDVWVVDRNLNLITSGRHSGMAGRTFNYTELPQNAGKIIKEVFTGKTVFSEDFSGLLSESTLTVGAPIKDPDGGVIGVVLLHSPIHGTNDLVSGGIKLFIISMLVSIAAIFMLSLWLSKNFTDPIISKEAEDALRLEKIRKDFVANISHELRTPVAVMRGSLEALVDKVVAEPRQVEEYHKQMLSETKFLERLVGDLLDLSRLQNADFIIEKQEISFNDVLENAVRSVSPLASQKGVKIYTDSEDSLIYGDYGRIRQMLIIVLDNAIKFSPENSVIRIILKNNTLTVEDRGAGIAETDLPYIFDRFHKSRSETNKSGTGLGLAIAKQIAMRHGIDLSAKSEEGKGATFVFKIPQK